MTNLNLIVGIEGLLTATTSSIGSAGFEAQLVQLDSKHGSLVSKYLILSQ